MIFKRFPDFSEEELAIIKGFVDTDAYKVFVKMAEIKKHNAMIGSVRIPTWMGKEHSFKELVKFQDRIETIKSFVSEFKDMAKEAEKREKKRKKK